MRRAVWSFVLFFSSVCFCVEGNASAGMHSVIGHIERIFTDHYAPLKWKEEAFGWNVHEEASRFDDLCYDDMPLKDFQRCVRKLMMSPCDYHVNVSFYATEAAFLPFAVRVVQDRVFVAWVDPWAVSLGHLKLEEGDEILTFDHRPVFDVIEEIKELGRKDASRTETTIAGLYLTARLASRGFVVPKGQVPLSVRKRGTNQIQEHDLKWDYIPEEIHSPFSALAWDRYAARDKREKTLLDIPHCHRMMKVSTAYCDRKNRGFAKQRALRLGTVLWEEDEKSPFDAYIFEHNKKKIGYVRIFDFVGDTSDAFCFADLMRHFDAKTDALMIDVKGNPGGNVLYCYALASMLASEPLQILLQRERISQAEVMHAIEFLNQCDEIEFEEQFGGEYLHGYPIDSDFISGIYVYFRKLHEEWKEKHAFSSLQHLLGIETLKAHPKGVYTKPILVLIDERSASCADIFPAILQDNGRALIVGTKTCGAGGYVLWHDFPNLYGVEGISYTGSMFFRFNGDPLENLGVTPDIEIIPTAKDLEQGYCEYKKALLNVVDTLF